MSNNILFNNISASLPNADPSQNRYLHWAASVDQDTTTELAPGNTPAWAEAFNVPLNGGPIPVNVCQDTTDTVNPFYKLGTANIDSSTIGGPGTSGSGQAPVVDDNGQNAGILNYNWTNTTPVPQPPAPAPVAPAPVAPAPVAPAPVPQQQVNPSWYVDPNAQTEPDNFRGPMWRGPTLGGNNVQTYSDPNLPAYPTGSAPLGQGTLHVRPLTARLTHNLDHYSAQDPYVVCHVGDQVQQTAPNPLGGQEPVWNDNLTYNLNGTESDLVLKVYDKDQYSQDDYIGGRMVPAKEVFDAPAGQKWVHLLRNGEDGGYVLVDWNYGPEPIRKTATTPFPHHNLSTSNIAPSNVPITNTTTTTRPAYIPQQPITTQPIITQPITQTTRTPIVHTSSPLRLVGTSTNQTQLVQQQPTRVVQQPTRVITSPQRYISQQPTRVVQQAPRVISSPQRYVSQQPRVIQQAPRVISSPTSYAAPSRTVVAQPITNYVAPTTSYAPATTYNTTTPRTVVTAPTPGTTVQPRTRTQYGPTRTVNGVLHE